MWNEVDVIIRESSGGLKRAWGLWYGQYHFLQEKNSQVHLAGTVSELLAFGDVRARARARAGADADAGECLAEPLGAEPGRAEGQGLAGGVSELWPRRRERALG